MAKTSRGKSGKAGRPRARQSDSGTAQPSGGLASGLTRLIASPVLLTFAAASVASAAAALLLSRRSRAEEDSTSEPPVRIRPRAGAAKSRRKAPRPHDATSDLPSPIELEMARSKTRRTTAPTRSRRDPATAAPEAALGQPEPSAFAFAEQSTAADLSSTAIESKAEQPKRTRAPRATATATPPASEEAEAPIAPVTQPTPG